MPFTSTRIANCLDAVRDHLAGRRQGPLLSVWADPTERQMTDLDAMATLAVARIRADAEGGDPHVLPVVLPDFGTVSTPLRWGGEVIPAGDGGGVHIRPVARTLGGLAARGFAPTVPFEDSHWQQGLDLLREVRRRLDGAPVFVRTPDFQGPLNTLALLVEQQELLPSLIEEPELVDAALTVITDALIDGFRRFRAAAGPGAVIGNIWPWVILPDDGYVGITQDYLPLLSPKLWKRLELPHLIRISRELGPVWLHCCGAYKAHLPNLVEAVDRQGLRLAGIECHAGATEPRDVAEAFAGRAIVMPYIGPGCGDRYTQLADLVQELGRGPVARHRWWFTGSAAWIGDRIHQAVAEWPAGPVGG